MFPQPECQSPIIYRNIVNIYNSTQSAKTLFHDIGMDLTEYTTGRHIFLVPRRNWQKAIPEYASKEIESNHSSVLGLEKSSPPTAPTIATSVLYCPAPHLSSAPTPGTISPQLYRIERRAEFHPPHPKVCTMGARLHLVLHPPLAFDHQLSQQRNSQDTPACLLPLLSEAGRK